MHAHPTHLLDNGETLGSEGLHMLSVRGVLGERLHETEGLAVQANKDLARIGVVRHACKTSRL